jgi:predicted TIM-barrel fold metal-dependent hydrolase
MANTSGGNGTKQRPRKMRDLPKINRASDTRDVLAHAAKDAERLKDYFIIDIDAHVTELAFWDEITGLIDSDVYRHVAAEMRSRSTAIPALMNLQTGIAYQGMSGRIPHDDGPREPVTEKDVHPQVVMTRRAMDSMGIDYMVVFPTPMLQLGVHPQPEVEIELSHAYNRWMTEKILPQDTRMKGLVYLPFIDPEECEKAVKEFGDRPGVIGFTVCSTRYKPIHHNSYMRLYAMIQESGKPLAFHAGYHWGDPAMLQINRFIGMHALSFVQFNMLHVTNWVLNGMPERFPKLKTVWVESGLAWVAFLMQRLDSEYVMRSSEAPLLKRLPSDYIREMYFTTQPLETGNMKLTEAIFDAVNAETQVLYSSDWPHWDFNPPNSIADLPFLSEQKKRNILGLNSAKLFNIEIPKQKLAKKPEPVIR